jgi:hypothetical protein
MLFGGDAEMPFGVDNPPRWPRGSIQLHQAGLDMTRVDVDKLELAGREADLMLLSVAASAPATRQTFRYEIPIAEMSTLARLRIHQCTVGADDADGDVHLIRRDGPQRAVCRTIEQRPASRARTGHSRRLAWSALADE